MPNAMALAGEYSARRIRVTMMMVISCGFTVGAALGGFISVALIASFGCGPVPLVLGIAMVFLLPESLQFLIARRRNLAQVHTWLRRIDPSVPTTDIEAFIAH